MASKAVPTVLRPHTNSVKFDLAAQLPVRAMCSCYTMLWRVVLMVLPSTGPSRQPKHWEMQRPLQQQEQQQEQKQEGTARAAAAD